MTSGRTKFGFITEFINKSSVWDALQNIFFVVIAQGSTHLFIRHVFPVFTLSPQFGDTPGIDQLENPFAFADPFYVTFVFFAVVQHFFQKLPQMDRAIA